VSDALHLTALLIVLVGLGHSYLGERFILIRLLRRGDLPKVLGSEEFTAQTLRFAWHITSIAWVGLAAVLVAATRAPVDAEILGMIVGVTFLLHFVVALLGSRGKHISWLLFLIIGAVAIYATRG
jgi:hypothetical protein